MSGSWPEFPPGNEAALSHGAHSQRLGREDAAGLLAEVEREAPPWLATVDRAALAAWAYAEGRCRRLRSWLDGQDALLRPDGSAHPCELLLLRWENRAAAARAALGFDPLSRARLTRDTAVGAAMVAEGLEAVRAAGRATRALPDAGAVQGAGTPLLPAPAPDVGDDGNGLGRGRGAPGGAAGDHDEEAEDDG